MSSQALRLTDQELEIMKVVWQKDSTTVRDVYEVLRARKRVAYTTVMTMMRILEQKGFLTKTLVDRAHVYRQAVPRQRVIGSMVRDFVERVFNGSAEPLLLHLVEQKQVSEKDLAEIARLLEKDKKR